MSGSSWEPYTESDHRSDDLELLRRRLGDDGYLLMRQLLPREAAVQVRDAIYDVAAVHGWVRSETVNGIPVADETRACLRDSANVRAAFLQMWTNEALHRLMHADELVGLIADLLGEDIFVHPWKIFRMMFPEEPGLTREAAGWHQDFPELQGSHRQLTTWTPLNPCNPETGALAIALGSHVNGLRPLKLANNPSGWEAETSTEDVVHCGALEPGDVLIFTTYTVHTGTDNWGPTHRVSIDCRYQPLRDPVCETVFDIDSLGLGWADVYRSWQSTDLQFYWRDLPLGIVPIDRQWELWREAAAIEAGRRGDLAGLTALQIAASTGSTDEVRNEAARLLESMNASMLT